VKDSNQIEEEMRACEVQFKLKQVRVLPHARHVLQL